METAFQTRLCFLIKLLHNHFNLPHEIVNLILYKHGGIASPSGVAWRTDYLFSRRLETHKKLIMTTGVNSCGVKCWCTGLNLAKVLKEAHAFGTSQQIPLGQFTVRHTSPPPFSTDSISYHCRCSLASVLTRIALVSLAPTNYWLDQQAYDYLPAIEDSISHDASTPFIPITIYSPLSVIHAWYVRTYKNVPIGIKGHAEALIYAFYKGV